MQKALLKTGLIGGLTSVSLSLFSHGYVALEGYAINTALAQKNKIIDYVATSAGYQKPEEEIDYDSLVELEALMHDVRPSLAKAVMHTESAKDKHNVSRVGALGLMQVMPQNAQPRCGLKPRELLEPRKNISCGVKILADELQASGGNEVDALWRYNGGPKSIIAREQCRRTNNYRACIKAKGYAETDSYAPTVLARAKKLG